jgi:periplasmic protein CpxP/Spy
MTGFIGRSLVGVGGVLTLALPLLVNSPALAQNQPPPPPAQMPQAFADAVEIRIAELHRTLHIVPSQEAAFRAYADVMRSNAETINALFMQRAPLGEFRAPAQLHWYAQLTAAHAEAINKLLAPFDALYQILSPDQQRAADRHFEQLRQRGIARRAGQ